MNLLKQALADNKLLLVELNHLLSNIQSHDSALYHKKLPLLNGNSIGAHVRHLLEHYQIFSKSLQNQTPIDYDHRKRCMDCQNLVINAQQAIKDILHDLESMPEDDDAVAVSIITNPALKDMVSQSSLLREMQFLQSHTVHHISVIGIALRHEGVNTDLANDSMTKAPSTVKFES